MAAPPSGRRSGSRTAPPAHPLAPTAGCTLRPVALASSTPLELCLLTTGHSGDSTASLPSRLFLALPEARSEITSRSYSGSLDLRGLLTGYSNSLNVLKKGEELHDCAHPLRGTSAPRARAASPGSAWDAQSSYLSLGWGTTSSEEPRASRRRPSPLGSRSGLPAVQAEAVAAVAPCPAAACALRCHIHVPAPRPLRPEPLLRV